MVIYSLAAGGSISVAHLFMAGRDPGAAARPLADRAGADHRATGTISRRAKWCRCGRRSRSRSTRSGASSPSSIILGGILVGRLHADRDRAAVACVYAVPGHDVRLSRLQMERAAAAWSARVVRTVGMVMIMIGFSVAFGYMMAIMRVPAAGAGVLRRDLRATSTPSCSTSTCCCCCSARSWTSRRCC